MTTAAIAITGSEALDLIAGAPDAATRTPADLRDAAADFERKAMAKDRLIVPGNGARRGARTKKRERDSEKLRLQAQITRQAADEVEARKCATVGDAMKPAFVRALRRIGGGR